MIFIVVKFTAKPEYAEDWLSRVDEFTRATRSEPGNLFFEWSRSADDPNQYVVVEAFRDDDAGAAHVQSDHFKKAMATMSEMVVGVPDIMNVKTDAEGWSKMTEVSPTS